MIRSDKGLKLARVLLVCCLVFIWGNSLLPGEISGAISDWVGQILSHIFGSTGEDTPSGIPLRKIAHFTEFAVLGALLGWHHGMLGKPKYQGFFLGAAAALVDETIQVFVPHRGPSIFDVCIDSSGVLTGMILFCLGHTYLKRRPSK